MLNIHSIKKIKLFIINLEIRSDLEQFGVEKNKLLITLMQISDHLKKQYLSTVKERESKTKESKGIATEEV